MAKKPKLRRFTEEEQEDYKRLARMEYGPDLVNESHQRWENYTKQQQEAILSEGDRIYADMAKALTDGLAPTHEDVQAILVRWHNHIRYFYEPTLEILEGLGETYAAHADFRATFEAFHVDLPDYLKEAIAQYVDDMETAVLTEMLSDDDHQDQARRNRLSL